jgi:hypothetical protein
MNTMSTGDKTKSTGIQKGRDISLIMPFGFD